MSPGMTTRILSALVVVSAAMSITSSRKIPDALHKTPAKLHAIIKGQGRRPGSLKHTLANGVSCVALLLLLAHTVWG